ncbi:MAG: uncharacterized protein QOK37_2549 [Thermoanaerobaculia bacterium]|nr:uncharacterized protein [Thermoanaerobaculia bacterium]
MLRVASTAAIIAFLLSSTTASAQSASASIQVSVAQPQPVAAGANFDYVINVSNEGPANAANMSLSFPLPAGVSFQSEIVPAGWSCNSIAPGTMAANVTCTTPNLAPGTAMFTITAATPPSAAPGTYSTTATISSTTPDPRAGDNSAQVDVIISTQADYSIALAASPNPVNAGAKLTWTMTLTNHGPSTGTSVPIDLTLPASTTFVSLTPPAGWSCSTPAVGSNETITCSLTTPLSPNGQALFTVVSKVDSSVPAGSTITATATVSSAEDSFPVNDSASASVVTAVLADLGITKVFSSGLVFPGAPVHYTITVTNNGPSDAPDVTMTDVLTAPHRFTSLINPGWSCTTPAVGSTGTITCSIPSMIAAQVSTFTLNAVIDPAATAGTSVINNVNVVSSAGASNSAGAATVVATPPNIVPSKTVNSGVHFEGSVVTYTIVLTNSGTLQQPDNPGNELTDVLPSSLTLVAASATSGTAVANVGANTVTWNGTVAGSGSVTITIQATVKSGTIGTTISNQASASYDSDWNSTNESTRQSDDPATGTPSDPTSFVVTANVPTLSNLMVVLLGVALAGASLLLMRK